MQRWPLHCLCLPAPLPVGKKSFRPAAPCRFEAAVEAAGGVLAAMPRAILDGLDLQGVSYAQVGAAWV